MFTANNPSTELNTKALETRWYNVRDYVRRRHGLLRIFHIGTNLNVADFFTKPLTGEKFTSFRNLLMGDFTRRDELHSTTHDLNFFARAHLFRPSKNPSCVRAL